MHPATTQALAIVQQGAPDGAASPEMLVARMIAELVSQNDQIRRLIQNPGSTVLLDDDGTIFFDNVDPTKRAKFQLSGLTTGVTRVVTLPDADATLLGEATTQTITNKSIGASQLTGNIDVARLSNALIAPGPIGGTTPAAGSFTDLAATDMDVATGTKTASNPVSITQTWNSGAVVFTALNVAITDTASANASNLFNFQYTNGSTNFVRFQRLTSTTNMFAIGGTGASLRVFEAAEANPRTCLDSTGLRCGSNIFGSRWTSSSSNALGTVDVGTFRNAAGVMEINDGTNAGVFKDLKVRALRVDTAANAGSGTATVAMGQSSIAVSNSLVSATSRIFAVVQDVTSYYVQRVTPGSGTFTIYLNTMASGATVVQYFILP